MASTETPASSGDALTSGRPVRIALVGLDHWYTAIPLAQAIALHPEAELVGIADADLSRAEQVAGKVDCDRVTTDGSELIRDESVDVVAAFASVDRNPQACVEAAENGKHIVSIKPVARTVEEATEVLAAVRKAGVRFLPAECRQRTTTFHRRLRSWVADGLLGEPLTATFQMWSGLPQGWPGGTGSGWFTDADRAPGGGWIDHSIYHIDLLRWLFGTNVTEISGRVATLRHPELPFEDYGHAQLAFDNGLRATIEDTWTASPGGGRQSMSIVGTNGAVAHDSLSGRVSVFGAMHPFDGWVHLAQSPGHADGIDDLIELARGPGEGDEPLGTVEDAWINLAICRTFYAAAAAGSVLAPPEVPAA